MKLKNLTYPVSKGINKVDLGRILPIGKITGVDIENIHFMIDAFEQEYVPNQTTYASSLEFNALEGGDITVIFGKGYVASYDEEWTNRFQHTDRWSGGDGIYSFNLTDGNDDFDQIEQKKTLFVFGDTFVGRYDHDTKQRFEPLLMPNNSVALLQKESESVNFFLHTENNGSISGFFKIDPRFDKKGTIPMNTVVYDDREENDGWLSSYNPSECNITYDLSKERFVTRIKITNYYQNQSTKLSTRGIRIFRLFGSADEKSWTDLGEYEADINLDGKTTTEINLGFSYRYFRFEINTTPGIGNYCDEVCEGLFGLNKVEFFNREERYLDVEATANTVLQEEPARSWIWLQDGVVVGKKLYFYPLTVVSDLTQPEGLQFRVTGINMISVPFNEDKIHFDEQSQKRTPFLYKHQGIEYALGGAVMPCLNDGYVYVYGYTSTYGQRKMIVSRVKAEEIENFDSYEYFDGKYFVYDIKKAKTVLDHISCEFSVSPILKGMNKGKYIAIYTYDVNTPYVAYSIGDSPVGPFTKPQIIYKTPEQEKFGKTTYTYNAKAHPHLSCSTAILVSYNTNTYSFTHNRENADVYNPRFIRLEEI